MRTAADEAGLATEVFVAESFIDVVCAAARIDPLFDGVRVLDGRDMPRILWLDCPTIIGHVDLPVVLADVKARLEAILPSDTEVGPATDLGWATGSLEWVALDDLDIQRAGYRVSLVVPAIGAGLLGAVEVVRRLREECPWDREQTHW